MADSVPQYLRDHASHLRINPLSVCDTALRFRQRDGLTLLALMASGGRLGYEALLEEMRRLVARGAEAEGDDPIDVPALASLARASVGWPGPDGDLSDSADLFQALRLVRGRRELKATDVERGHLERLEVQTNLSVGRQDYVSRIAPDLWDDGDLRWMVATELAHPVRGLPGSTWEGWLEEFNQVFVAEGLAPVTLTPGEDAPFDRLAPAGSTTSDRTGPLVTVVMAAYKPDASLVTALRSMIDQTWGNLEVLVVDDCSPDSYVPILEEAVALDDRFTLHRMPVNGGPYRIRNFAIEQARGEFVTFQDSDDWSHPERIERQMRALLDDANLVASFSRSVRLTSSMSLNKIGFAATRRNVSSLLFRRGVVREVMGTFDEVRKSGDSEFSERLRVALGDDRICWLEVPMAIVQLTEDSLSRQDFMLGYRDPDRVSYRQEFEHWHSLVAAGTESPRLEQGTRRFPAPPSHLGLPTPPAQTTVAVVADWRSSVPRYAGMDEEVQVLVEAGVSTTVLHAESMRFAKRGRGQPTNRIMELRRDHRLTESRWDVPLEADLVLVRDPELLSYPRPVDASRVRAGRVVIHAPIPPRAPGGTWLVYDPAVVEANAEALFGVAPSWQPATSAVAEALTAEGVQTSVLPAEQLGVIEPARPRDRPWADRPVLGTAGLDKLLRDRLSADELLRLLPQDERLDVRIRDDESSLDTRTAPKPLPPAWQRRDAQPLEEFLASLDVYVCWSRRSVAAERPHTALLAMALGCVVVAPPELAGHFGDAAAYTDGQTVEEVVLALAADPDEVEAQRQRGYDFVTTQLSHSVLVARVLALAHR